MQEKLKLYQVGPSSACERIRIAMELKGLVFESITISDLPKGEYLKVNPQGLMPTLQIGDRSVSQSMAMLEYLEDVCPEPALLPKDPVDRAEVRAFCQIIASDVHPVATNRMRKKLIGSFGLSEEQTLEWYDYWAQHGFSVLEKTLETSRGDGPWCFGAAPTFADLVMIPHMHTARGLGIDFSGFPNIMAVFEHCTAHPAFIKSARENQPDA